MYLLNTYCVLILELCILYLCALIIQTMVLNPGTIVRCQSFNFRSPTFSFQASYTGVRACNVISFNLQRLKEHPSNIYLQSTLDYCEVVQSNFLHNDNKTVSFPHLRTIQATDHAQRLNAKYSTQE